MFATFNVNKNDSSRTKPGLPSNPDRSIASSSIFNKNLFFVQ